MMKPIGWLLASVEGVAWFSFFYVMLYSIKNIATVSLWQMSLMMLVLLYITGITCPLVRLSHAWKKMWE